MMLGAILGIIIKHPTVQVPAVTSFNLGKGNLLFPMLFVTVACGAISGFHSLVGSGTTSKQLQSEKDIKLIGYGSMLIEGVLAVVAIITAAYIGHDKLAELLKGGAVNVFSDGIGNFMASFGIPFATGKSFTALAISAFALTSLDTATRLGRFIFQEMFDNGNSKAPNVLGNKYVATLITVVLGGALTFKGWQQVWPIFGSANQLLAALALLTIAVFLKNMGKEYRMAVIPTVFMFLVTEFALVLLIVDKAKNISANWLLIAIAGVLFVLAIVLMISGIKALSSKSVKKDKGVKV